ncbi:MAG: hypothetical protein CM1200mP41_01780 [Gammaproteobacteria bacterium]|nr:MAG: hypothetical protein CM1200mP41_01780 [Gammaproteobacteria bacterium]
MLSGYVTTNQRSVDFSYVIGAGNQTCLGVEDYLEGLVENPAVNAFGLYVEPYVISLGLPNRDTSIGPS